MKIYGITRKSEFSPNNIYNDTAIFNEVCHVLEAHGVVVEKYNEDDFLKLVNIVDQPILTMGRSIKLLSLLQELERKGTIVINSSHSIENCFRTSMTLLLLANNIPFPDSVVLDTASQIGEMFSMYENSGLWIKRGDFHATRKEDVSFAKTEKQANDILSEFALKGIEEAVLTQHIPGDLLKFYGVSGTDFFYWFYPYEINHQKFDGYELINGKTSYYKFDEDALRTIVQAAADVLGVKIFGGDAIIQADGTIVIIDMNDWPSFAPCRFDAAKAIASIVVEQLTNIKEYNLSISDG